MSISAVLKVLFLIIFYKKPIFKFFFIFKNFISLYNYNANSAEGEKIKQRAPPCSWVFNNSIIGIVNAAVLPDPVGAVAIKLRFYMIIGIACICIGVGLM